jgi:hypothetical protein
MHTRVSRPPASAQNGAPARAAPPPVAAAPAQRAGHALDKIALEEPARGERVPLVFEGAAIRPVGDVPVAPEGPPIQGVFVYLFIRDRISDVANTDDYYRGIGFVQAPSADGVPVWCRPGNQARVAELHAGGGASASVEAPAETPAPTASPSPALLLESASQIRAAAQSIGALVSATPAAAAPAHDAVPAPRVVPATRRVRIAALRVATHNHGWQAATSIDRRIELITDNLAAAQTQWGIAPNADALCVFVAPEYMFAAQSETTYFMSASDQQRVAAAMQRLASGLPPNVLFIPGTVGWSQSVAERAASLPPAVSAPAPSSSASSSSAPPSTSAPSALTRVIDDVKARHRALEQLAEGVSKTHGSDWDYEAREVVKSENPLAAFNEALIYFGGVATTALKVFESTEGALDKFKAADQTSTLFVHGVQPHADTYMDVRVTLEICSDFANGAAQAIGETPALQIVVASNYGGGGGEVVGTDLLLTDSTTTALTHGDDAAAGTTRQVTPGSMLTFYERVLPTTAG